MSSKWFLVNMLGFSLTSHTSMKFFNSKEEAEAYKKKYKHVQSIKLAKIVKGVVDPVGFVIPDTGV